MSDPDSTRLLAILLEASTPAAKFEGVVYRSCAPQYARERDLVTGEGSRRFGGRWNPVSIAMVYASLSPEIAMAETLANHRYYGIPIENVMPRMFVAIDARLVRVVDLRNDAVRLALAIDESRCRTADWRSEVAKGAEPITQRPGRAAHAAGWEGLVVPSAVANGHNLLILPDHLAKDSSIVVRHNDRLDRS